MAADAPPDPCEAKNPYGSPPGSGISRLPSCRPTPPVKNRTRQSIREQAGRPGRARSWRLARVALGILLLTPLLVGASGWAGLALWFDGPSARLLAGLLAGGLVSTVVGVLLLVRPLRRGLGLVGVLWLLVLGWWLHIPARNDRNWQPDVARCGW